VNEKGEILFHRNMRTDFDQFKKNMCLVSAASQIPFYGIGGFARRQAHIQPTGEQVV
jgi:hypothetical protein